MRGVGEAMAQTHLEMEVEADALTTAVMMNITIPEETIAHDFPIKTMIIIHRRKLKPRPARITGEQERLNPLRKTNLPSITPRFRPN